MNKKATNKAMCFKEEEEIMILCKQIPERSALGCCFYYPVFIGGKNSGIMNEVNGEVLEEINFIGKSFLPFKTLGICGTAPHFIDLKR